MHPESGFTPHAVHSEPMSPAALRLVADVGGTHTRFALAQAGEFLDGPRTLPTRAFASLAEAAHAYLRECGARPDEACIAVAGPVDADTVRLTNHDWEFSHRALAAELGVARLGVLNDFEAIALALPHLGATERLAIGGGTARAGKPLVALGPGTGLGVAQLVPTRDGFQAIATEGGHASIGPANAEELRMIAALLEAGEHASRESLLSGPGIERIHRAVCALRAHTCEAQSAAQIQQRAVDGTHPCCRESLEHFCAFLGTAAADQALCCGAQGGVYIAGGIVPRFTDFLRHSRFRARFEDKGPMSAYLRAIPVFVITRSDPGLLGAALATIDQSQENAA